jgi:hypothetical protein
MTRTLLASVALCATLAGPAAAGDIHIWQPQRVDPFNDPRFPLRRYDPLVQHNRLNGDVTIYQPVDPAAPYTRDYSAPRTVYDADSGTLYQTLPGGGARDWSAPSITLEPMDFGFGDE